MVDSTRKEQFFCSICNTKRGTVLFSAPEFDSGTGSYQIYQCSKCLLIQTQPTPTKQALTEAYNENYYGGPASKFKFVVEQWTLFAARRRARRLLKIHGHQAQMLRILDIGCGRGVLLNALRDLGQHVTGLERSDSASIATLSMLADWSIASIDPLGPTTRAAMSVCSPVPAATSSTLAPFWMLASSSILSVTALYISSRIARLL